MTQLLEFYAKDFKTAIIKMPQVSGEKQKI